MSHKKRRINLDGAEMGYLLGCGWQHTGDDRWLLPGVDTETTFNRAEALAVQRAIDSGAVVPIDQLNKI